MHLAKILQKTTAPQRTTLKKIAKVARWRCRCPSSYTRCIGSKKDVMQPQSFGARKINHIDVKALWLQECKRRGDDIMMQLLRLRICPNLPTHHSAEPGLNRHLGRMCLARRSRPDAKPLTTGVGIHGGADTMCFCSGSECSSYDSHNTRSQLNQSRSDWSWLPISGCGGGPITSFRKE